MGWEDSDDDDQNAGKMSKKKQRAMLPSICNLWIYRIIHASTDNAIIPGWTCGSVTHGRCRVACQLQS